MEKLARVLLERAMGWLELSEIQATKTVCHLWSSCVASCPVVDGVPNARAVNLHKVECVRIRASCESQSRPGHLELDRMPNLKSILLKMKSRDVPLFVCQEALERRIGQYLQQVEWEFAPLQDHMLILGKFLSLPQIRSLVLTGTATGSLFGPGIEANPAGPLEHLAFVDCRNLNMEFMDNLAALRSLGFIEKHDRGCVSPANVPRRVQARIQELNVKRYSMLVYTIHGRGYPLDLGGYSDLRRLRLESVEHDMGSGMDILLNVLRTMPLEQLELYVRLPGPERLISGLKGSLRTLDLRFRDWPRTPSYCDGMENALGNLRSLTLRHVMVCEHDRLETLLQLRRPRCRSSRVPSRVPSRPGQVPRT